MLEICTVIVANPSIRLSILILYYIAFYTCMFQDCAYPQVYSMCMCRFVFVCDLLDLWHEVMYVLSLSLGFQTRDWIEGQKMNAFLSVTRGSVEPPVFLEVEYQGGENNSKHLALIGKGECKYQ